MASSTVPTPPADWHWLQRSAVLAQIRENVSARGISVAGLARAIARPEAEVQAILEGRRAPPFAVVEAMLRALRLVPVVVSTDDYTCGASYREYLSYREGAAHDRIEIEARAVIEEGIRDLTLQRARLEQEWAFGLVSDREYRHSLVAFTEELRRLAVSLAKLDAATKLYSGEDRGSVEVVYTDPEPTRPPPKRKKRDP